MTSGAHRLDATHDPERQSWVESAQRPGADFPIQNLPYGVFSRGEEVMHHVGVAIGDHILDLTMLEAGGLLRLCGNRPVFGAGSLNPLMSLGSHKWHEARVRISELLTAGVETLHASALATAALVPQRAATMHRPFDVRGYTDFYSSREHASNVGTLFRGGQDPLPANWLSLPIAYNGRPSTVVVSGTDIRRPVGQVAGDRGPLLMASRRLDMEIELGAVVGTPTALGTRLDARRAAGHIFGYVLLNDWSARDLQIYESRPLGPFQSKAFATTISPWVVTSEALLPYRVPAPPRLAPLFPYLDESEPGNLDLAIEARFATAGMAPVVISRTNARTLYYSAAQQLAHHTLCGCAMESGDLLGSGTISGPTPDSFGSLLELTWNGERPLTVGAMQRTFLEDGDQITLAGHCEGAGYRVGFGEASGTIIAATAI